MHRVGDQMAQHLTNTIPQYSIAAELATFEWPLSLAYDAAVLTIQGLAAIPPETWGELCFNNEPCLIWRSNLNSHYRSLDQQEFQAIKLIKAAGNFGALCECLFITLADDETQQAAQYLADWLEAGMISKIKVELLV
ncbi:MAG: Tfp pilus assembly protein PilN [Methylophilaceae bacterium]|jgi:Tfp pilus assembly protein PilN